MAENKENLRKFISKKVVISIGAVVSLFLSIVIMTLAEAKFDINEALSNSSNLVINAAIAIASIICGYYLFQSYLYNNPNGEYQASAVDFRKEKIEYEVHSNSFADWHSEVYYPQERQAEFEDIIRRVGIQQLDVLNLDMTEIKGLLDHPQKYNGKFFMSLTQKQVETLLEIKSGKITINKLPDDYFYDIRGMFSNHRAYIQAGKEGTTKSVKLAYQIISKVLLGVVTTSVFAGLLVNNGDIDNEQRWLNLITRLYTMLSNILYGYIVTSNMLLVELYFIKYKTHVLQLFNIDIKNGFKAKSIEEKAKEEFIKLEGDKDNEKEILVGGD